MSFRLWLRKTACERLLMARRKHLAAARRSVAREEPLPDASSLALGRHFLAPGSTPSHKLSQRELIEQVRQAIAQLARISHHPAVHAAGTTASPDWAVRFRAERIARHWRMRLGDPYAGLDQFTRPFGSA